MYFSFAFLFLFFETLIIGGILRQKNNKIEFYYLTIYFFAKSFRFQSLPFQYTVPKQFNVIHSYFNLTVFLIYFTCHFIFNDPVNYSLEIYWPIAFIPCKQDAGRHKALCFGGKGKGAVLH